MAYENVTIPAEPMWNETEYPYMIIGLVYKEGAADWDSMHAYYSSAPYTYVPGGVSYSTAKGCLVCHTKLEGWQLYDDATTSGAKEWHYLLEDSANEFTENAAFDNGALTYHDFGLLTDDDGTTLMCRYRTNHDIYDENGRLYLTADGVTEVFSLKDWISGLVIGTASKPIPFGGTRNVSG